LGHCKKKKRGISHFWIEYVADTIGNLVQHKAEAIEVIKWTVPGKVKEVKRDAYKVVAPAGARL